MAALVLHGTSRKFLHLFVPKAAKAVNCGGVRFSHKKFTSKPLYELYRRRLEVGPDKPRRRSEWINWNYKSELYGFGKRLGEDFNDENLRTALVDKSYVDQELSRRADLSPDQVPAFNVDDNKSLSEFGETVTSDYVKAFLRYKYTRLPEEGICSIHDHLMSAALLSHVGRHLGLTDIVLCQDFPASDETVRRSLLAVVGCLAKDSSHERAYKFVQDFVIPELVTKDVNEFWPIVNPMGLLERILTKEGMGSPEPRLLRQCGSQTVMAAFQVGIYSDKEFIGQGYGETTSIAEEKAARDSLRRIFGTERHNQQLPLDSGATPLTTDIERTNLTLADITSSESAAQINS